MDIRFAEEWLEKLKSYWQNKDAKGAVSLFRKTEFYQETPFCEPYTTFAEIEKEWEHIEEQNIKKIEFKILAIDGNTLIVEWIFKRDFVMFDGIYEIKFNEDLESIYFKSWEVAG